MRLLVVSAVLLALACAVCSAQPAPPAPKPYVLPAQAPALPTQPSILFLKGPNAENWQVEAAAKLLGATLKTSNLAANAQGDRLDYLPATIEELFQYNLVVIGNVDYVALGADFTAGLKYFVEHGGGLLALGGDHAFGQGGYAGTPLEDLLPIKCGDKTGLKPAGANALLVADIRADFGLAWGDKPRAPFMHVPAAIKPHATVGRVTVGTAPFMIGDSFGGNGTAVVILGAALGEPADGPAFWQWRDWPRFLAQIMHEQTGAPLSPPPAAVQGSVVKLSTTKGDLTVETFDKDAPITAGNFLLLVKAGFYNGVVFHRVVPGFVIQGGDSTGTGQGGPGWAIPLEVKPTLKHDHGVLSMARTDDPNTAGSQFFICLGTGDAINFLDMHYAVFGKVLTGLDVVDKIAVGDKMLKVTLEKAGPDEAAAEKATLAARIK